MGKVWYERSTNNGAIWTIQNNGKPLSSNDAKLPSIDYYTTSYIFITWQEEYEGTFKIRLAHMSFPEAQLAFYDVWDPTVWNDYTPYSYDAMPVVSWGAGNVILVSWKFYGIMYRYGYANNYSPVSWYTSEYGEWISGTDVNSTNPTIAVRKDNGTSVFHLAWQQSTTAIKYRSLTPNGSSLTISSEETPSTGDGVNYKKNPSISVVTTSPTLVWIRSNYEGATTSVSRRTRTGSWGSFTIYGTNVESPTEYNSRVVWSENNVNKLYHPWKGFKTLSTIGKSVQLSTGTAMYAVAYRQTSPFDFQITQNIETLPKMDFMVNQCGREGIVAKGEAEFYFILADAMVNSEVIKFEDIDDTTIITNINELNQYLSTKTFSLNEGSIFNFSVAYGVNDSIKALNELNNGSNLEFKLELVDAITNEILGVLDNFVFDEYNICAYHEQTYEVNTQGIGNRTVKLRVNSNSNFDEAYYLADILTEENVLGKSNTKELSFTGGSVITSYDLFQNYPNPFNPATTINYQIPEDGMVILKIYDILGKEIKTLINEEKTTGMYEVNFDASDLASGVYVYRIQVNDYVSVKKMMLVK